MMNVATNAWQCDTRPCDISLSLNDGEAFADFRVDKNQCVCLIRISFDGYGCCETDGDTTAMSAQDSRTLIASVERGDVDNDVVRTLLLRYFDEIKPPSWDEAFRTTLDF